MNTQASTNETAFNAYFGQVLRSKHPLWRDDMKIEQSGVFQDNPSLRPDILVLPSNAQPVVIETEFDPAATVEAEARARLGLQPLNRNDVLEQTIAVRLPNSLKHDQADLMERIEDAEYGYCVFSGEASSPRRWPVVGWLTGSMDDVARCVEHAMVSQRLITESIDVLEEGVLVATAAIEDSVSLGFTDIERDFGQILNQRSGEQTNRMAMTIIANALIFHSTIAGIHAIPSLSQLLSESSGSPRWILLECWNHVLTDINYWPIFKIASDLLAPIRAPAANQILRSLIDRAERLAELGVTTMHDLSGRMFQKLIVDRKFLATFYTLPTSAALLAELSVRYLNVPWKDLADNLDFRMADLSCGTGTLLSAAYQTVLARYRHTGGDDRNIHGKMIEDSVIAADIMPAAAHLCASQLSSLHPTVGFDNTRIYTLPYALGTGEEVHSGPFIGSLDLIRDEQISSLFPTGQRQVHGAKDDEAIKDIDIPRESLDLVIMNPPFTSPTNHKVTDVPVPSFAGFRTTEEEQLAMSNRLKQIRKGLAAPAGHGNAGLASNFLDLAHAKVKPGGVIAFVLPIAFIRGKAWQSARALLERNYSRITLVTVASANAKDRAFSADTEMAETLLIAIKKASAEESVRETLFVNLHRRPSTILEATEIAKLLSRISDESRFGYISAGDQELGNYIFASLNHGGCAALRTSSLADVMINLFDGKFQIPRMAGNLEIPMTTLGNLGERGKLDRDIGDKHAGSPPFRGPFTIRANKGIASYPMLWNHDANRERSLVVAPDSEGVVRSGCEQRAVEVWRTASRLHFNRDFGLSGQSTAACLTSEPTLGGRAWPNFRTEVDEWQELLALWSNCTLGLMSFWWMGSRQHDGRAILTISSLPNMKIIDARTFAAAKLEKSVQIFRDFEGKAFLPANEAYRDEARHALDRAVLIDILDLPGEVLAPLDHLRRLWCAEPSVHGGKRTGLDVELRAAA